MEIHRRIAPTLGGRLLVPGPEALVTRPRVEQPAVHVEMIVGQQPPPGRPGSRLPQEGGCEIAVQQPIPILRERRRRPHAASIPSSTNQRNSRLKSSCSISCRSDRVEDLQPQRAQQLLRRNRRAPEFHVQGAEARRESGARAIVESVESPATDDPAAPVLRASCRWTSTWAARRLHASGRSRSDRPVDPL